uniref:Uncharacterized protein n=1 Tax=Hippocampus comes TaxID=109280 RepID=A0A3Q2XKA9_HIPCM
MLWAGLSGRFRHHLAGPRRRSTAAGPAGRARGAAPGGQRSGREGSQGESFLLFCDTMKQTYVLKHKEHKLYGKQDTVEAVKKKLKGELLKN